ncbi:nitroreductase [Streptomyces sp. NBC_01221]|uniref:Acg family FMN-binding oxidoreductase n=1 Tax=unclassified Streptomyces TaxID=2593676 RepID=UPI00225B9C27|nr:MULTISPECIES: nitroreductase [unclassified Streptomyces]WSP53566.1 nitroreductase [Streptomyces sp. NBC_01241]WSU25767.1 nitroreductase [Streptomyces sp. NBC_01108]MCX4784953.1 nitroreductase [Streptomyces sp. NBC_01221]MCX4799094.1 nitroreductase [Streptomyces sp. NBC_01242]WSJ40292.1 nitroreductase [Streptomyces sp. NBC_01321]
MLTRALDDTTLADLVADATAAPSMHNAQPWQFRYTRAGRTLTLRADFERAMPEADPATRALHVGCGAALLNLRVSAAHHGLEAVTALLPEPSDPAVLATVRLGVRPHVPQESADEALAALHPAIRDRHTSRYPFDERVVPEDVRADLAGAARTEGADFAFLTPTHLETVLELIRDAEGYDRGDPAREAEQEHWTRNTKTEAPVDGIPDYAFGPRDASEHATTRDFAGTRVIPGRARVLFENRPQLALLSTPGDRPTDWLHAGQALERVLLTATLHQVSASFATQPLEWPDLRWILRDPVYGTGHPQMIIRLGYGPSGPRTPRRPLDQVLTIEP